jgi:RNA polymerase sigma-70 factor, ECF subfamily
VAKSRRLSVRLVDLEALERGVSDVNTEAEVHRRLTSALLLDLVHRLEPPDRQVIFLHLEGEAAASIAEVTGLSAGNVATKVHRIKKLLKQKYFEGAAHGRSR